MLGRCCCSPPLTAASCSAAQHCSTHGPTRPVTSGPARPTERVARPCEALEEEPTQAQRAPPGDHGEPDGKAFTRKWGPRPGTAPGILCPASPLLHSHTLIDVYYLSVTPSRGRRTTSTRIRLALQQQQSQRQRTPLSRRSRGWGHYCHRCYYRRCHRRWS